MTPPSALARRFGTPNPNSAREAMPAPSSERPAEEGRLPISVERASLGFCLLAPPLTRLILKWRFPVSTCFVSSDRFYVPKVPSRALRSHVL